MEPKSKPFDITTDLPAAAPDAGSPFWLVGSHDDAERKRRALLMRRAPELLKTISTTAYRCRRRLPRAELAKTH
jgi:hypothetical protein